MQWDSGRGSMCTAGVSAPSKPLVLAMCKIAFRHGSGVPEQGPTAAQVMPYVEAQAKIHGIAPIEEGDMKPSAVRPFHDSTATRH